MNEYTDNNENFYNQHKQKLEKWLEYNVYQYANNIVHVLLKNEIINNDNIDNLYKPINQDEYAYMEEYENALNNQSQQDVYEWYLVSEEAYNKFGKVGDVVVKCQDIYFWGRSCTGQSIKMDFYDDIDKLKIVLNL